MRQAVRAEPTVSTIVMANVTSVDMAVATSSFICTDGVLSSESPVVGDSFNVSVFVTGSVEAEEQVVVDFGTLKKAVKALLDGIDGPDHKLWVSKEQYKKLRSIEGSNTIRIPDNALFIWDEYVSAAESELDAGNLESSLYTYRTVVCNLLTRHLLDAYPGVSSIAVQVNREFTTGEFLAYAPGADAFQSNFRYVHGLRSSTSYGCRNLLHGHFSRLYLQLGARARLSTEDSGRVEDLLSRITSDLHNAIFVYDDNVDASQSFVGYKDVERGLFEFSMRNMQLAGARIVRCHRETTVENLTAMIVSKYERQLLDAGVRRVFVTEGLNKGCLHLMKRP